jgi:CRP/FNR family transcriptional regulator, cyclic AMP receptor protein
MSEVVSRDAVGAAPAELQDAQAKAAELIADANLASRRFDVPPDAAVYETSTPARSLYVLHSGQVRILLPTPGEGERSVRLLEILGPGDWFGAPALMAGRADSVQAYGTRALAVTAASISEVPAEAIFAAMSQQPEIATAIICALAGKLQTAYAEAAGLVFDDTNRRLIKALLEFSRSSAATEQDEGVELRITHQQLAQKIGAARETVSLALTQLRQKNLLRTGRNRLSFNRDALATYNARDGAAAQPVE